MKLLGRRQFAVVLVTTVSLALFGRWAMSPDDGVNVPQRSAEVASTYPLPAKGQPLTIAEAPPHIAPSTDDSASAFGTLRGQVIDAVTRKPVREFEVRFYGTEVAEATKVGDDGPGARTFQTVDGRFEWEHLPPGDWVLNVSADGYQRFWLVDLHISSGDAGPEITLPLRAGHRLRGRVYDEASDAGIASATVSFRESDTGTRFEGLWGNVYVTSANDGTFVLGGLPQGRVTLGINAPGYARRELEVVVGKEPSPVGIGLVTGGTIAGRLTAADGITPVKGNVLVQNLDQGPGFGGSTGEAGEFSFQHLAAGRYRLRGWAEDGRVTREFVLASNQRIEGMVLALGAGHTIRGVVTGLRPEDLKEVSIWVYPSGGYVDVDGSGAYALPGVPPGRVQVVADVAMRRQLSKTVEMPADSDITVNFYFPTGARLSGRVTRGGKPLPGVRVTPQPVIEQAVDVYGGTHTSKEGEYVLGDLPVGDYDIWVSDYMSWPIHISGDTVFNIDVPLAQLSGRVLEERGNVPVVGADVAIWPAEPGSSQIRLHDSTDHSGQFALAGLEPGDVVLAAYKPGYELFRQRISYNSPVADMTIRLRQQLGVEIKVREAGSGKPLQWIQAIEMMGGHHGARLQLQLDKEGTGYLPSALAGSTLSFSASGYAPTVISAWSGQRLDLRLERQETQ